MPRCRGRVLISTLILAVAGLSGCNGSGNGTGTSGPSLVDKAKTIQVCVDVAGSIKGAATVGANLSQGAITQSAAMAQLQPIANQVTTLAGQNSSLPISKTLAQLSDSITAVEKVNPTAPADIQAAANSLATATKGVLTDCASVGK